MMMVGSDALHQLREKGPVDMRWANGGVRIARETTESCNDNQRNVILGFALENVPHLRRRLGDGTVSSIDVRAGDGWILLPGKTVDCDWRGARNFVSLEIDASLLAVPANDAHDGLLPIAAGSDPLALQMLASIVETDGDAPSARSFRETMTAALAAHVSRNHLQANDSLASVVAATDQRIAKAVHMIEEDVAKPLPLPRLASAASLSQFAFVRLFKRIMGEPPHRFQTSLRIARAKELLRNTSHAIHEVGYRVGWENTSYFTQVFRRAVGMTPGQFRAMQ
jgi:AraC-like DNA-binding protein